MHGRFEWVDVSVPDLEAASAFYTAFFGWSAELEGGYVRFFKDGRLAAGMNASPAATSAWHSYVTVTSADAIAERGTRLGAKVVAGPIDIGTQGRMVYLEDPQGGRLGFWEPGDHRGADAYNEPGFLTWNELRTRHLDASLAFYRALLPEWVFANANTPEDPYLMGTLAGRDNCAITRLSDRFPPDTPTHWAVWFTVADAESDVARIEGLGGASLGPLIETSYGPAARVADPFGAPFFIIGPMVVPGG